MHQLSAMDASFLYAETPLTPMHVSGLQIYEPDEAIGAPFSFDQIVDNVRQRAAHIPCFYRKLATVPLGLDHPYWVDDADFDPARHISMHELTEPGGWSELCAALAELHAQPLDRTKPLWSMHIIPRLGNLPGIAANAYAVVTKIHHAAVDGVAGISVTAALHDIEPVPGSPVEAPFEHGEAAPSRLELLYRTAITDFSRPIRTLGALPMLARLIPTSDLLPRPPQSRFNGRVGGKRVFDALHFSLEELRKFKSLAVGATVNDVVLTIVGGGLRKYFQAHGALPSRPMTVMVPVNIRAPLAQTGEGNRISQIVVSLGTDIEDVVSRLHAIQHATAAAKQAEQRVDKNTQGGLAELAELPPAPWLSFTAHGLNKVGAPALVNTVVTNVKAPAVPLYSCGAKLVRAYGTGPIVHGAAVFHTALSYCGVLNLSVMSCVGVLPDMPVYLGCLRETYDELMHAL